MCAKCHPGRKAETLRPSHMPLAEGKMTCSDCHNPHGSNGPSMLSSKSINENCYRCHAEKRGPFLWEHPPVTEDCTNCHAPHGSVNPNLLKVRSERLCQRCHISTRHPSQPEGAKTRFVFGHDCLNCHSQIHGSNHPSGEFFLR
jgi:DmsE family decaheme c-type cytochrome